MESRNSWLLYLGIYKKGQKGRRSVEEKRECLKVHVHRTLTPHSELDQAQSKAILANQERLVMTLRL